MVVHLTKATWGGAGRYAVRLSAALRDQGVESVVCATEDETREGTRQIHDEAGRLLKVFNRVLRRGLRAVATETFHTGSCLTRWNLPPVGHADIVHLHGLSGWIGFADLDRWLSRAGRVFWTCHDIWPLTGGCCIHSGCNRFTTGCGGCPVLARPARGLARREHRSKHQFATSHTITPIANSRWMADQIEASAIFAHTPRPVAVVPPIVDAVFLREKDAAAYRQASGVPRSRFAIGLGARSVSDANKGIGPFLAALGRDSRLAANCSVLIAGDGRVDVPPGVDVHWAGELSKPADMADFYRSCDVFVSPSAMETFGMALVEAQASGAAVAGFAVGGVPEAVCPANHEWLVAPGDMSALLDRLAALLSDPDRRAAAKSAGRDWAVGRFSPAEVASLQTSVYAR